MNRFAEAAAAVPLRIRAGIAVTLCAVSALLFHHSLTRMISLALADEHYTHVLLIPPVVIATLFLERRRIFDPAALGSGPSIGSSTPFLAGSAILAVLAAQQGQSNSGLTLSISALTLLWVGIFIGLFGWKCLRRAIVPALLMLLFIPLPLSWVLRIESALQYSSAEMANLLFRISGAPVYREDLFFTLPGVRIEVAPECSGIRSSFALFIASLVIGNLCLFYPRSAFILAAISIPLMIVKNGVRIFTLAMLGSYVSRNYLEGELHQRGGALFFLLAVLLLIPPLWALRRMENKRISSPSPH